ncbi:hypothetical protein CERSUDRAFT_95688 [Gelatoporia subvermispora B]|uniref:Uncharacterized protein n=1 Tax=Ceriporiopsis subvermispora (strain B) TaxID=914234 RepID=M2RD64_CERS8|nr:hypothetical protein CERSUDRAFT_95688 [Gelatoporia subvermispora B]
MSVFYDLVLSDEVPAARVIEPAGQRDDRSTFTRTFRVRMQREDVTLDLLSEYVARLQTTSYEGAGDERILFIAHEELLGLYEKAGSMRRTPTSQSPAPQPPAAAPDDLWAALERASSRPKAKAQLLLCFANGVQDLNVDSDGSRTNKYNLLCPREGCGSVILKDGSATAVERESVRLEHISVLHVVPLSQHE